MQIAICDDDRIFLEHFCAQVEGLGLTRRVDCFDEPGGLFSALKDGMRYDAVLMDLDWGREETGMDLAERLGVHAPQTKVIYVTGYSDRFSQRIFLQEANLSGYLVKPVDEALLRANLEKAANRPFTPTLTVSVNGKSVALPCSELVYLESRGHAVIIHTREEAVTVYEKLDKLALRLPEGFLRCHKSFLVNMRCIRRFQAQDALLDTGAFVPVSRSRCAEARAAYFRYMGTTF